MILQVLILGPIARVEVLGRGGGGEGAKSSGRRPAELLVPGSPELFAGVCFFLRVTFRRLYTFRPRRIRQEVGRETLVSVVPPADGVRPHDGARAEARLGLLARWDLPVRHRGLLCV